MEREETLCDGMRKEEYLSLLEELCSHLPSFEWCERRRHEERLLRGRRGDERGRQGQGQEQERLEAARRAQRERERVMVRSPSPLPRARSVSLPW